MVMFLVDQQLAAGQSDCASDCKTNYVTVIRINERLAQRAWTAVVCVCNR